MKLAIVFGWFFPKNKQQRDFHLSKRRVLLLLQPIIYYYALWGISEQLLNSPSLVVAIPQCYHSCLLVCDIYYCCTFDFLIIRPHDDACPMESVLKMITMFLAASTTGSSSRMNAYARLTDKNWATITSTPSIPHLSTNLGIIVLHNLRRLLLQLTAITMNAKIGRFMTKAS